MHIVVFEVAGQRYAVPLAVVREIFLATAVQPLLEGPAVVEGLVDVRGSVTPVVSLRRRLGLERNERDLASHFIRVNLDGRSLLLRTDRVVDVVEIDPADLTDVVALVPRLDHLAGAAQLPDGLTVICDIGAFLSEAESLAVDELLREAGAISGSG